jgi:hypothetical protein
VTEGQDSLPPPHLPLLLGKRLVELLEQELFECYGTFPYNEISVVTIKFLD